MLIGWGGGLLALVLAWLVRPTSNRRADSTTQLRGAPWATVACIALATLLVFVVNIRALDPAGPFTLAAVLWSLALLAVLRSGVWGSYLGLRYRFLTGALRPYVAAGVPLFFYSQTDAMTMMQSNNVAVGLRAAGGLELYINGHFSVLGDLGYEHYFNAGTHFDNYFAPTIGVIGRL